MSKGDRGHVGKLGPLRPGAVGMIDGLEVNHLRTLDALYRFGSITTAAEHLDLSQQAVSQQLKRLRELLGDRLFVPSGPGVAPTPYARRIEPRVRQILVLLHEIPASDALALDRLEGTLTVSATDYAQRVVLGPLLRELQEGAPRMKLAVVDIEGAGLPRRMHQGEIDLALTSGEYVPAGLISEALFRERYRCVSADRALAAAGELPLARLVERPFVVVSPGVSSFRGSASAWFERKGLRRDVAVSVPSFFLAQEYLRGSEMVGFLPSRLLPCDGLFELDLEDEPPGYEVVAAYHPSARSDPLLGWLLERIRVRFADVA